MIALYWAWRLGMVLVGATPRWLSMSAATFFGWAGYYVMPLRRRIAQENFAHVLGKPKDHPDVRRVTRAAFQNFTRLMRDMLLYPSASMTEFNTRVTFSHPEHFEQAFARGKGVILVSAHFGNMDIPAAVIANRFKPITLVGETLRPPQLMELLTRARTAKKVTLFPYDRAPRKMIEALKRNETIGLLLDFGVTHHFDITTVPVKFFNTETDFPAGPAQIALMTSATIIVGVPEVAPDGRIVVRTFPPLILARTANRQQDIQTGMQLIAQQLEKMILNAPEQWYIFRPMWKDMTTAQRKIPSLSQPVPNSKTKSDLS